MVYERQSGLRQPTWSTENKLRRDDNTPNITCSTRIRVPELWTEAQVQGSRRFVSHTLQFPAFVNEPVAAQ